MTDKNKNKINISQIKHSMRYSGDLGHQIQDASLSIILAYNIDMEEMYNIGATDSLVRLQRNTLALKSLLSQAKDAYECIKSNIHAIEAAYEQAEENERKHKEEAIKRAKNKERERKKYERKKAKANK